MSDATAGEGKPLGSGRLAQRDPPVDGPFFSEKVVELTATRKNSREPAGSFFDLEGRRPDRRFRHPVPDRQ